MLAGGTEVWLEDLALPGDHTWDEGYLSTWLTDSLCIHVPPATELGVYPAGNPITTCWGSGVHPSINRGVTGAENSWNPGGRRGNRVDRSGRDPADARSVAFQTRPVPNASTRPNTRK